MGDTVRVNFGKAIPLFALPDTVLLPHALLPLHVSEPRYRQMVSECLDGQGQLAIATFASPRSGQPEPVAVRSITCVSQIIEHQVLADGRYNILLHGVCRARIRRLIEPDGERSYRLAALAPIEALDKPPEPMPEVRQEIGGLLAVPALKNLRGIETLLDWVSRHNVPTHALLELIGFTIVRDTELKYQLLAEADPRRRARIIAGELRHIDGLMRRVRRQRGEAWPKGMSWN
jgi:hypothetical protein